MINKKECEIVQDLLMGYADSILNFESQKLVERHLINCENCQFNLEQIKEDRKEKNNQEEIELDYLKKIRIRTKIKSILIAIAIIIFIAFILFLNKFIKINTIMNKAKKSSTFNNLYIETSQICSNHHTAITKEYYKDGKYKMSWMVYSNDGIETSISTYSNLNSNERILIYDIEKKAIVEQGDTLKTLNNANNIIHIPNIPFFSTRNNLLEKIGATFIYSIDTYHYGRECYVLKNKTEKYNTLEVWIDKEIGLPVKEIKINGIKSFFPGTNVVKEIRDNIKEYKYEFDKVTEEDVKVPDLSNYTIEHRLMDFE